MGILSADSTKMILSIILGVSDALLHHEEAVQPQADALCLPLVQCLFTVWLRVCGICFPDAKLWDRLRHLFRRWRLRYEALTAWGAVAQTLTARVVRSACLQATILSSDNPTLDCGDTIQKQHQWTTCPRTAYMMWCLAFLHQLIAAVADLGPGLDCVAAPQRGRHPVLAPPPAPPRHCVSRTHCRSQAAAPM